MKVLVTAATRHHGTHEIAEAIAAGLAERGVDAETIPIGEVTSVDPYGAVVLGSAVYRDVARRGPPLRPTPRSALCVMPDGYSAGPLGPAEHPIPPDTPADVPVLLRLTVRPRIEHLPGGSR